MLSQQTADLHPLDRFHGLPGTSTDPGRAARVGRRDAESRVSALTERERDVISLVGEGLSNGEIGRSLFLSASTVKDHVSAILGKLGVTSRVQAALLAQLAGLERPRPDGVP